MNFLLATLDLAPSAVTRQGGREGQRVERQLSSAQLSTARHGMLASQQSRAQPPTCPHQWEKEWGAQLTGRGVFQVTGLGSLSPATLPALTTGVDLLSAASIGRIRRSCCSLPQPPTAPHSGAGPVPSPAVERTGKKGPEPQCHGMWLTGQRHKSFTQGKPEGQAPFTHISCSRLCQGLSAAHYQPQGAGLSCPLLICLCSSH